MKERNWINLVTSLKHDQCILVLGPDLSIDCESADGSEDADYVEPSESLAAHLAQDLEEEDIRLINDSLISITQQYEDAPELGPSSLRSRVANFYQNETFSPGSLHKRLVSLPFSLIITTRHDSALESALNDADKKPLVARYNMRGNLRDNPETSMEQSVHNPLLFRLFGDPSEPESMVLTENDILDFVIAIASSRPALPSGLIKALKQGGKSFLFIGFGIKDWYLRVLLKIMMRVLEIDKSAFAVASESLSTMSDDDRETTILFFSRGKRVEVEDSNALDFLDELESRLGNVALEQARPKQSRPLIRVFISYAREDENLASELESQLMSSGFDVWRDVSSLEGGDDWDREIKNELQASDFALVICSDALYRKTDSYVNKEIHLACERDLRVRGQYLIPLRTSDLPAQQTIDELASYNEMPLNQHQLEDNIKALVSSMKRSYQRRQR